MPGKMSDSDTMHKKIMKSGHDAREPETKEGIEFECDAGEPETMRDRIQGRCWRNRNKRKGSNLGHDAEEPEIKRKDRIRAQCRRTRNKKGIESGHDAREPKTKEGI